jgi:septal ring factor EnvC (AmiA/AmiB activator)
MARRVLSPSPRTRASALAVLAIAIVAVAWAVIPLQTVASPSAEQLRSKVDQANQREQALSSSTASLNRIIAKLDADVALLSQRVAAVEADLARERAQLDRLTSSLARERERARRLTRRLAHGRKLLATRLVERYQAPAPDLVTVVLTSNGFSDLLERQEFLRRIQTQDTEIVTNVRDARAAARVAAARFARLHTQQAAVTAAVQARRDGLAQIEARLADKRAQATGLRAAQLAALKNTRGARQRLERQLAKVQKSEQSGQSFSGANGNWSIPWAIVECESGGRNWPPNSAGASGYYQIIPSTWSGFGGHGPAAWLASKAEQDRVASLIWNHGAGIGNWDCARIVGLL